MPDIEPQTVGVWDDTQLDAIDQLMMETKARGWVSNPCKISWKLIMCLTGIKLIIAMHDRYRRNHFQRLKADI